MKYILLLNLLLTANSYSQDLDDCFKVFNSKQFKKLIVDGDGPTSASIKSVTKKGYNYLNESVEKWFKRDNVSRSQKCLSCHTTLPYMLLGAADNVLTQKNYIRELVKKRTDNFKRDGFVEADNLPWYDLDKSYSTETVLNASAIVMPERINGGRAALSDLAQDTYDLMWKRQNTDGSFSWLDQFGLRPHESQNSGYWGTSMAGVMGGMVETQATAQLKKTYSYLKREFDNQSTHNKLFGLWANAEAGADSFLSPSKVDEFMDAIKAKQNPDGGWSADFILGTGNTDTDAYATSIIAYVLKTAKKEIPNESRLRHLLVKKFKENSGSIGGRNMSGAAVANSPNGISTSDFFSDMATSYGLMYLNK